MQIRPGEKKIATEQLDGNKTRNCISPRDHPKSDRITRESSQRAFDPDDIEFLPRERLHWNSSRFLGIPRGKKRGMRKSRKISNRSSPFRSTIYDTTDVIDNLSRRESLTLLRFFPLANARNTRCGSVAYRDILLISTIFQNSSRCYRTSSFILTPTRFKLSRFKN